MVAGAWCRRFVVVEAGQTTGLCTQVGSCGVDAAGLGSLLCGVVKLLICGWTCGGFMPCLSWARPSTSGLAHVMAEWHHHPTRAAGFCRLSPVVANPTSCRCQTPWCRLSRSCCSMFGAAGVGPAVGTRRRQQAQQRLRRRRQVVAMRRPWRAEPAAAARASQVVHGTRCPSPSACAL